MNRPKEQKDDTRGSFLESVKTAGLSDSLVQEFDGLETIWTPPEQTGFEAAAG